ncbi:hypothetical protein NUW54_g8898 [Trametes sanguinea]|uniref:Uncharacterized protein n=1 Tax=Trametes sanguinea TaxID=158606 RepID=A0ACC1PB95_9APHY|nr:hypothetical protein NUW54_g8898 [Trametes sanguinea]
MQAVTTSLTGLLGTRVPVVSAAMAFASSAKLAVSEFSAQSMLRALPDRTHPRSKSHEVEDLVSWEQAPFATPDSLREELAYTRKSFPDLGNKPLPIGLGYIGWLLDANEEQSKQLIDISLEFQVPPSPSKSFRQTPAQPSPLIPPIPCGTAGKQTYAPRSSLPRVHLTFATTRSCIQLMQTSIEGADGVHTMWSPSPGHSNSL